MLKTRKYKPLVILMVVLQFASPACAAPPLEVLTRWFKPGVQHHQRPQTCQDDAIEELARNIDWLEKQLDQWGTVVAKAPDVWGEARLTAHRQEIEQELRKELSNFDFNRISGAQFVSDQAMLAAAFSLKSQPGGSTTTSPVAAPPITVTQNSTEMSAGVEDPDNPTPNVTINAQLGTPATLFGLPNDKHLVGQTLKLEQTELLDQLNRYLHHLASLRRINEGDDTADAPGYSLNLVRIPVSVMPGKHSKQGYGAEITVTATPHLGPELLPMAYRDFVINDLLDQLAVPMTRYLNGDRVAANATLGDLDAVRNSIANINTIMNNIEIPMDVMNSLSQDAIALAGVFFDSSGVRNGTEVTFDNLRDCRNALKVLELPLEASVSKWTVAKNGIERGLTEFAEAATPDEKENAISRTVESFNRREFESIKNIIRINPTQMDPTIDPPTPQNEASAAPSAVPLLDWYADAKLRQQRLTELEAKIRDVSERTQSELNKRQRDYDQLKQSLAFVEKLVGNLLRNVQFQIPSSGSRRSTLPFPVTQLFDNYGLVDLGYVAEQVFLAFRADVVNRDITHLTDVQAFLREELAVAYDVLATERMQQSWLQESTGQRKLFTHIRKRELRQIQSYREQFIELVGDQTRHQMTARLAWCIFVESILLNERLIQDMRETAGNRPCECDVPDWLPFFGPDPPLEARMAFNEYVRCRWPVRVFALDPVVNEQNIADISSVYRQMQMAVVLAFAGGEIGTSAALQAVRKLQRDRATIDLNRTAVAFGHGEDTFGWRFYPRFQTPPVEGNMTVLFRDLILGGPTDRQLEQSSEIEPGMRECVAVVLMPSFVPYMTIDTRGNWFKLTNPAQTAMSMTETVEYSRSIRAMQNNAMQCVRASHHYRNGEVERLLRRVQQLDRELPLQTLPCQVPIENTHGGFEIFSSGTRELAPELLGWYGAPGYNRMRPTRMFLAGDNFSISQSRLIVGNHEIPFRLLSRQIMEVTLPPGLTYLRDENLSEKEENDLYDGYVDAHIATPYGVSGHLLIPVVREARDSQVPFISMPPTTIHVTGKAEGTAPAKTFPATTLTSSAFPHIDVLPYLGIDQPQITVKLYPTVGKDRLATVPITNVSPSPDGRRYDLRTQLIEQFKNDAALNRSLGHYVEYLLNRKPAPPQEFVVNVEVAVEVEVGAKRIPVEGNFVVQIKVEQ